MPYQQPASQVPGPAARRSAMAAYAGNQRRPMRARDDGELGQQIRYALWKFASQTGLRGVRRDQAAITLVRNRYPASRGVFSDQAIAATIRQVGDSGACHWDALRVLTAAADEAMPTQPTSALLGLLGRPCARCRAAFAEAESYDHERRLLASGYRRRVTGPQPTGALWPAGQEPPGLTAAARAAASKPPPRFYGSKRVLPGK
jgi:hypothetical protein